MDHVVSVEPGTRGVFEVAWDASHPILEAHFPGQPVVPGVLLLEAMAQAAGCVWQAGEEAHIGAAMLVAANGVRFRAPVGPGETVTMELACTNRLGPMRRFAGTARIGDRVVAQAELTLARPPSA